MLSDNTGNGDSGHNNSQRSQRSISTITDLVNSRTSKGDKRIKKDLTRSSEHHRRLSPRMSMYNKNNIPKRKNSNTSEHYANPKNNEAATQMPRLSLHNGLTFAYKDTEEEESSCNDDASFGDDFLSEDNSVYSSSDEDGN